MIAEIKEGKLVRLDSGQFLSYSERYLKALIRGCNSLSFRLLAGESEGPACGELASTGTV